MINAGLEEIKCLAEHPSRSLFHKVAGLAEKADWVDLSHYIWKNIEEMRVIRPMGKLEYISKANILNTWPLLLLQLIIASLEWNICVVKL